MMGRNFTLRLNVGDEQFSSLYDCIADARIMIKNLKLAAVEFEYAGTQYSVHAGGRVTMTTENQQVLIEERKPN